MPCRCVVQRRVWFVPRGKTAVDQQDDAQPRPTMIHLIIHVPLRRIYPSTIHHKRTTARYLPACTALPTPQSRRSTVQCWKRPRTARTLGCVCPRRHLLHTRLLHRTLEFGGAASMAREGGHCDDHSTAMCQLGLYHVRSTIGALRFSNQGEPRGIQCSESG